MNRIFSTCAFFLHVIAAIATCTTPFTAPAKAAESMAPPAVAVLPFAMHAPESMAYLQAGLRDMLATRLAANSGVSIIENSMVDAELGEPGRALQQEEAASLAEKLGADYLISGSITSLKSCH